MNVAVVGLGRVGLPLALSFADRGLDVIGVEREPAVLEQVGVLVHAEHAQAGVREAQSQRQPDPAESYDRDVVIHASP